MRLRFLLFVSLSVFQLFSVSAFVFAQPQQSENFRIPKSVLDASGGAATSTNFRLISAFGQPAPIGYAASPNFTLYAGFLTPAFQVSPLSPIQDLVIQRLDTTAQVRLDWGVVPGAVSYTIYRDTQPNFVPDPDNPVGTSATNSFTDTGVIGLPALRYYYIVTVSSSPATATTAPPQKQVPLEGPVSKQPD